MKKALLILTLILSALPLLASREGGQDSISVSLVTCWPGREVYSLCGHEAIRVQGVVDGHPIDSVWNYGMFDFTEPNFVYRFVKGETDYHVAGYPFAWFMPEYVYSGRRVVEQVLNFSQDESRKLLGMLRQESLPENRTYRYNYVKDNCATRPLARVDSAATERIVYPDNINYGTFRKVMRKYHQNYPWYQFGIDLALGSAMDRPIRAREEMFAPIEMMQKVGGAHFADGRQVVSETNVLYEGVAEAVLPPTPWWKTPLAVFSALFVLSLAVCAYARRYPVMLRTAATIWFSVLGVAGCIIAFLVLFSQHEGTSPNILILWMNPLLLILSVALWIKKSRIAAVVLLWYETIVTALMLIVWGFALRSLNIAILPIAATTFVYSAVLAWNMHNRKKNEEYSINGALRTGHGQRRGSGVSGGTGASKARGRNRN